MTTLALENYCPDREWHGEDLYRWDSECLIDSPAAWLVGTSPIYFDLETSPVGARIPNYHALAFLAELTEEEGDYDEKTWPSIEARLREIRLGLRVIPCA